MARRAATEGEQQGTQSLLAALDTDSARRRPGVPCTFHLVRLELRDDERERVDAIVSDIRSARTSMTQSRYSAVWLADTLTAHGHYVGRISVQNHLAYRCRCGY